MFKSPILTILWLCVVSFILQGCQLGRYQDSLQQGYPITKQRISELKIGQTQDKVEALLGSPTLIKPGNDQEWAYINITENHITQDTQVLRLTFNSAKKLTNIHASRKN